MDDLNIYKVPIHESGAIQQLTSDVATYIQLRPVVDVNGNSKRRGFNLISPSIKTLPTSSERSRSSGRYKLFFLVFFIEGNVRS